jgi:chaperonin GroES
MQNNSGIKPLDMRVLVLPDPAEEVTKGGIIIIPDAVEKEKYATVKATLVAVGVNAWAEARAHAGFVAPHPGMRVMIAKYGGVMVKGHDGADYRIMNDEDITAILEEAA